MVSKENIYDFISILKYTPNKQYDVYDVLETTLKELKDFNFNNNLILSFAQNIKCMKCGNSVSRDHNMMILNINNREISRIDHYFNNSYSKYMCNECNQISDHLKSYSNISSPQNILIHIIKQGNDETNSYPTLFEFNDEEYELLGSINRSHFNNNSGHFYNTIIHNHNDIMMVSDDKVTKISNYYDKNALFLLFNRIDTQKFYYSECDSLLYDKTKNKIQCKQCMKLISRKHIQQHIRNMHNVNNFSLKNFKLIDTILMDKASTLPKQKCEKCNKEYSIRHIKEHFKRCKKEPKEVETMGSTVLEENHLKKTENSQEKIISKEETYSKIYIKEEEHFFKFRDTNLKRQQYMEFYKQQNAIMIFKYKNSEIKQKKVINLLENKENLKNKYSDTNYHQIVTLNTNKSHKNLNHHSKAQNNIYYQENNNNIINTSEYSMKRNKELQDRSESKDYYTVSNHEDTLNLFNNCYHSNYEKKENHSTGQKTLCEFCSKLLSIKNIRQHYSRYHPKKLTEYHYKCNINSCLLSYPTKAGLSYHQKKHHICEYLNMNFKNFKSNKIKINTFSQTNTEKSGSNFYSENPQGKSKTKKKPKSIKQILYDITGKSFESFCRGSHNDINTYKSIPNFISQQKTKLPNKIIMTKVYKLIGKDLLNKYAKDVGNLPTNRLDGCTKPIDNYFKNNLDNMINNIIKDIILLTNKYTNIYSKSNTKPNQNDEQNIPLRLVKEFKDKNYVKFNFMIKNIIKSNERILIYKEFTNNKLELNNIKSWSENEKMICLSILNKLYNYEKKSNNLDDDTVNQRKEFKNNASKYINNIIYNMNSKCQIQDHTLIKEFKDKFSNPKFKQIHNEKETPEWWNKIENTFPSEEDAGLFQNYNYISEIEFNQILSHMKSNSSPGPDGLTYTLIKHCVGIRILLRKILNTCLYFGFIPENFRISTVTLIDKKKEDKLDISNWRPICLSNVLSKILTKWITNKLYNLNDILSIRGKNLFSDEQRGFRYNINGCTDHSNVLSAIYEDSKRNIPSESIHRLTNIAIDFKDAFTSVPHYVIHKILSIFKIPRTIKTMIIEYYNKSYLYVKKNNKYLNEKILINRGVKQGDPLSPLLFNLILEPLIRLIKSTNKGYQFKSNDTILGILAYADDVILLSNDIDEMEILFTKLEDYCMWSEISINPNKCVASSSYQLRNGEIGSVNTNFYINNNRIEDVGYKGQLRYLGSYVSNEYRDIVDNTNSITHNVEEQILQLSRSKLSAIQKIKSIKLYILPKLEFIMKNCYIDINELIRLDNLVRNFIKEWLYLPNNYITDIFYLPWYDGGLGIPKLEERYVIGKITSYINLYNSNNYISNIIKYNQSQYEVNCNIKLSISKTDFLNWTKTNVMNTNRTHQTSLISKIYNGCKKYKIKLEYNENNCICLNTEYIDVNKNPNRKFTQNCDFLKEITRQNRINKFVIKKYQSVKRDIMINNNSDNFMFRKLELLNDNILRNTLLSRSDTFPTNYNKHIWYSNMNINIFCEKCPNKIHNLFHILQDCKPNMPYYKDRHDNACSLIYSYIKCQKNYEIYYDKNQENIFEFNIPKELKLLRPDMILLNRVENRIIIIEVAFFSYNSNIKGIIESKEDYKYKKYKNLVEFYKEKGFMIEYFTLLFDSTGFIINNTKEHIIHIFNELKLKKSYIQLFNRINMETIWNTSRLLNSVRSKNETK